MSTKDESGRTESIKVPILKIRMMTDDEWNRMAYRNFIERQVTANVKS